MSPCGQAPGKRGLRIEALVALGLFSAVALSAVACRTLRRVSVRPVCAEASQAYAQAQAVLRTIGSDPSGTSRSARDRVRELTRAAQAAAPDWVAPARVQDDLLRGELRGVEALEAHRQRLARSGEDARELYLAGRLEGIDGEARFSRAAEIEPDLAWARHGLAWSADRRGDARSAVAHARAALSRARDPWERSFFASSLARFLSQAGRREEALAVLAESLAAPDLSAGDRIRLAVESIGIGLGDRGSPESTAAFRRGLDLLREEDLTDAEVDNLVAKMRALSGREEGGLLELSTALAGKRSPARDRLRAELMLAHGPTPLALGLLERSLKSEGCSPPDPCSGLRGSRPASTPAPSSSGWRIFPPACAITTGCRGTSDSRASCAARAPSQGRRPAKLRRKPLPGSTSGRRSSRPGGSGRRARWPGAWRARTSTARWTWRGARPRGCSSSTRSTI
jgi:tetratricopeptide (TPR) repeat protein